MANLTETEVWQNGIMQIESGDPVLGGASGISNIPHRELASRTGYLKATHEAHVNDTADPHENAKYAKQADLQAHFTEASDPHAAAGYSKAAALAEHIADINDPHEAALYLKESTHITHVDDMNDPHAAAGYAKSLDVESINSEISTHLADTNPHLPAGLAKISDLTAHIGNADDPHAAAGYIKASDVSGYTLPIATAGVLGGIRIGNNLSIDAATGVLDAIATGSGGITAEFSTAGVRFSNGLIIKWGKSATITQEVIDSVSFNTTYPFTECYSVVISPLIPSPPTSTCDVVPQLVNFSNGGFQWFMQKTGDNSGSCAVTYIAIGTA